MMQEIRFAWVCRNIHFNQVERVELTDEMLLNKTYPSWVQSDNCEIIAKILPTGLKDRNGKEVWEGDIVRKYGSISKDDIAYGYYEPTGQVYWDDEIGGFGLKTDDSNFECMGWLEMEVIGDIYSNPEPFPAPDEDEPILL